MSASRRARHDGGRAGTPAARGSRDDRIAYAGLILALLLAAAAYARCLAIPFQFDDISFVEQNSALRGLWPPQRWIQSEHQETRPLVNLTFALNYAWSRQAPWSYHVVNWALHAACVVLLFVFVRRSLRLLDPPWPDVSGAVAAGAALLLASHTAHSESVLYIQGRPGLFITVFGLAAFAACARLLPGWDTASRRGRATVGITAWVSLGMLSKESAAVIPALILVYDAAVVARGRWSTVRGRLLQFHLPVWATLAWLPLLFATLRNPHRGVFGLGVVDNARFYLTQAEVLLFYLKLYLWPTRLTVDRAFDLARVSQPVAWLALASVLLLAALTLWTLKRAPWPGFLASWWWAALLPTSLIPNHEFVAERYMTFATPAAAALAAWAIAALWQRLAPDPARLRAGLATAAACAALAAVLAWHTYAHSAVWLSGLSLWKQALTISPTRGRGWYQYAWFLWRDSRYVEAEEAARRARVYDPRSYMPSLLISRILADSGRPDSAEAYARESVAKGPNEKEPYVFLAQDLQQLGRWQEALDACDRSLRIDSTFDLARYYRAQSLVQLGDTAQARLDAVTLERRRPDSGWSRYVLGLIDVKAGCDSCAVLQFERALHREPNQVETLGSYAMALFKLHRPREALAVWSRYFAVSGADRWDFAVLYYTALCHQTLGEDAQAVSALRKVIALNPRLAEPWVELAYTLAASRDPAVRDPAEARRALEEGLRRAQPPSPAMRARADQVRAALERPA